MKKFGLALALGLFATGALAGGIEPVMDPVVVEAAASSANDNWAGIVLTLLLIGTALN
jgi:ABC-type spermidine/putrescine transport system permease subunit I